MDVAGDVAEGRVFAERRAAGVGDDDLEVEVDEVVVEELVRLEPPEVAPRDDDAVAGRHAGRVLEDRRRVRLRGPRARRARPPCRRRRHDGQIARPLRLERLQARLQPLRRLVFRRQPPLGVADLALQAPDPRVLRVQHGTQHDEGTRLLMGCDFKAAPDERAARALGWLARAVRLVSLEVAEGGACFTAARRVSAGN